MLLPQFNMLESLFDIRMNANRADALRWWFPSNPKHHMQIHVVRTTKPQVTQVDIRAYGGRPPDTGVVTIPAQ